MNPTWIQKATWTKKVHSTLVEDLLDLKSIQKVIIQKRTKTSSENEHKWESKSYLDKKGPQHSSRGFAGLKIDPENDYPETNKHVLRK